MLIAALAPAAVQAQPLTRPGRITGTVFDSTSMLPLAGAMVQVVRVDDPATARQTSTDAQLRERLVYVRGQLRDAEHGGRTVRGTVRVQWLEFAVTRAGMERSVPTLFADTDEDGSFTACGVPTEGILRVRGWSGADSSGAAELTVPPDGILLRDLYVGRA